MPETIGNNMAFQKPFSHDLCFMDEVQVGLCEWCVAFSGKCQGGTSYCCLVDSPQGIFYTVFMYLIEISFVAQV